MSEVKSWESSSQEQGFRRIGYKCYESHDLRKVNDQAMRFAESEVLAHPARELINISSSMSKYAKDHRSRHGVTVWYRY